jgi:REP element-mobilizing transposase RayT
MSEQVHRSHNVSVLLYHIVCPAKYRRAVFSAEVDGALKDVCLEIALRYELAFIEIGTDRDHVHFLVQAIPAYSPTKIVRTIKSITAREIFFRVPAVRKYLWGGEFWSDGYYISTVGRYGSEGEVQRYIADQGRQKEYVKLHSQQLRLF